MIVQPDVDGCAKTLHHRDLLRKTQKATTHQNTKEY